MELLFGFVGGVAAIALKGAVDFYFEWRRERRELRAAARLLGHELEIFELWLDVSVRHQQWIPPESWTFDLEVWRDAKSLLASSLGPQDWLAVTKAYRDVGLAKESYEGARESGRHDLSADQMELVRGYQVGVARGAEILESVAGKTLRSQLLQR